MKKQAMLVAALMAGAGVPGYGQGSLTPPGAPTPLMKTLDQVEARIPLVAGKPGVSINASGTITISQRGSYYLTDNLTISTAGAHGIVITASQVTLDLNGFALICTSVDGGSAVQINNASNVHVCNGRIIGGTTAVGSTFTLAGWENGVSTTSATANLSAENIHVQGVRNDGIGLSYGGSRVDRCSVQVAGSVGIYASSISSSTARKIKIHAISSSSDPDGGSVSDCFGESVGTGNGISAIDSPVSNSRGISVTQQGILAESASNCYGTSQSGSGISATSVSNSTGVSTSSNGISADSVANSSGISSSGIGILADIVTNSLGTSSTGTAGIQATGTASFCRGSRASGTAISAPIAIGCTAASGTISSAQKHLGTP